MVQVAIVSNGRSASNRPAQDMKTSQFVFLAALMAAIGGLLFGYDTGIISSAMLYIPDDPRIGPLSNIFKGLIVSITPGMAGIGSLIAGPTSDAIGRKKTIMVSSAMFTVGALVSAAAIDRYVLLTGRIILGFAIGFASMIVPIYVSEVSPAHIRGRLITGFKLMLNIGIVFSNIVAAGFSYIDQKHIGWRLMVGFAGVPSLIQFIGFLFVPESPRYLANHGQDDEAENVLGRIYNGQSDWVKYEMEEIKRAHEKERNARLKHGGSDSFTFLRVLKTPHVRKALIIGSSLQIFQQMGGINTLLYYTGTIIRSTGVKDTHSTIWIACGISSFNFIATLIPLYLIERIGRRVLLLLSVGGVIVSQLLMGGGFLLINRESAVINASNYNNLSTNDTNYLANHPTWDKTFKDCMSATNCDYCVTMEKCGYCDLSKSANVTGFSGQCLPVDTDDTKRSQIGVCSKSSNVADGADYTWAATYCKTKYTIIPIVIMVIYLIGFSSGYGPVPWVFNAEVYPLWARSTCVSFTTFINWTFNLIISLTFLTLTEAITKYGAFFLYAGITMAAFIIFFVFVPETKGVPIEEVEMLFMSKAKRTRMKMKLERSNGNAAEKPAGTDLIPTAHTRRTVNTEVAYANRSRTYSY